MFSYDNITYVQKNSICVSNGEIQSNWMIVRIQNLQSPIIEKISCFQGKKCKPKILRRIFTFIRISPIEIAQFCI